MIGQPNSAPASTSWQVSLVTDIDFPDFDLDLEDGRRGTVGSDVGGTLLKKPMRIIQHFRDAGGKFTTWGQFSHWESAMMGIAILCQASSR